MINDIILIVHRFITSKFKILYRSDLFKRFVKIYSRYTNSKKEMILYIIFGALTTVVNIVVYLFFAKILGIDYLLSNVIAWVLSIIFAYITNRLYVFESKNKNIFYEFALFISGRGLSGILDSLLFYIFVFLLLWDDFISKIIINIIVIIINYIMSKKVIFKEKYT